MPPTLSPIDSVGLELSRICSQLNSASSSRLQHCSTLGAHTRQESCLVMLVRGGGRPLPKRLFWQRLLGGASHVNCDNPPRAHTYTSLFLEFRCRNGSEICPCPLMRREEEVRQRDRSDMCRKDRQGAMGGRERKRVREKGVSLTFSSESMYVCIAHYNSRSLNTSRVFLFYIVDTLKRQSLCMLIYETKKTVNLNGFYIQGGCFKTNKCV